MNGPVNACMTWKPGVNPLESSRLDRAEVGGQGSVIRSVEIAPVDRDGLVMAKPLFATTL